MFVFEYPGVLFFLSVIPVLIYFNHIWRKRGGRILFPFLKGEQNGKHKSGKFGYYLSWAFFWIGIGFCIIAAAGPKEIYRKKIYLNRGSDIIFVMDASPSMAARDFQPENRFYAAKKVIASFVENRGTNYFGLVTFGKNAVLELPPTKNYKTFLERLEGLTLGIMGDETAIGLGLGVACAHLQYSTAPKKIIVLLTDGENNAGPVTPLQAAGIAAELGVTIYICGIGKPGQVPVEYVDPETGTAISGIYESRYDEELLTEIARLTGGLFFSAPQSETLAEIFKIIDKVEKEQIRTGFTRKEKPFTFLFAVIGFSSLLFSFLLRFFVLREAFI